ncbi:MAG: PaaI family thioesterase [Pseudomonadota bacterium]
MNDIHSMSGLDQLRAMAAGDLPPPPMAITMNLRLIETAYGLAVFSGTATEAHLNPMGAVHGGWYGTILDSALGCAVHSTLAPGERYTTLEFKINITRALRAGVEVICQGETQHRGRSTAVARAEITGAEDDKLYATGSTTCLILPGTAA